MNHNIVIKDHTYSPANIKISAGDSITWENRDAMRHSATRTENPPFDTGLITAGTISSPIEFPAPTDATGIGYFCIPHPFMRGLIVVDDPT